MNNNFVRIGGEPYYKISNSEELAPFFINVPSASDIWIFMSSCGGLTAGRKNADGNIFPYETDDKLMQNCETGSKTLIKVDGKLWQPFEQTEIKHYKIQRNIYKSCYAASVIFEEINEDLSLGYSYKYESSEKYGFVKTSKLTNLGEQNRTLEVLDGMMNILPFGVNSVLQATGSTLVDAYKMAELADDNLALYSLSTTINDTPYPIEMLKANICYNTMSCANVYLNPIVTKLFTEGKSLDVERENRGGKCAYYIVFTAELAKGEEKSYSFVLDNGYDHSAIVEVLEFVKNADFAPLFADIQKGVQDLITIVEKADGLQTTGDEVATATHYLSTLYNCMRGGVFESGYELDYNDFLKFVALRNKNLHESLVNDEVYAELKTCTNIGELKQKSIVNADLQRLVLEYLPLSFSRRHGDPSRPWNKFNISIKDENGDKALYYEGNWRDIFQNWEALGLSYPAYYENMLAKFVNASTFDGFNPYRISTMGIDWEKPEPENPFSGLGYWGDHQIIYLLRLLQGLENHFPEKLQTMLAEEIFSYANVPYKIADYKAILKDSKNTILFDVKADEQIAEIVKVMGNDGRLILKGDDVLMVNLAEKLLVPALSKAANLMVGGGIWMNTGRPEWNDANNAIVGIGLSMVTVYHLSAYLDFLQALFERSEESYAISTAVTKWLCESTALFANCAGDFTGKEKALLDAQGELFSTYRNNYYNTGLGEKISCDKTTILNFIKQAKLAVSATIAQNKTEVFASYNLLNDDFTVSAMQAMLEGQSAAVGSGFLTADEVCDLAKEMEKELYSQKLRTHTLYPVKITNRFFDKNTINANIDAIDGIVCKDFKGALHFDASVKTSQDLIEKCTNLGVDANTVQILLDEFERLFSHKKFTGRSCAMYKFEGIGCVYWHQNAKFLLAILETAQRARANGEDIKNIMALYDYLLQGFIYRKSPKECNAIPIEPYSHTAFNGKSEQPGMTGQVKESVIMRRGELGVIVKNGVISFDSAFLRDGEFDENGKISFALCGLPVCYNKTGESKMQITLADGTVTNQSDYTLDKELCKKIFERTGEVASIDICV